VTGSAAEKVAEFIILSAKPVCRLMLLEAAHTSDASFTHQSAIKTTFLLYKATVSAIGVG
jgi:hypothetical protein